MYALCSIYLATYEQWGRLCMLNLFYCTVCLFKWMYLCMRVVKAWRQTFYNVSRRNCRQCICQGKSSASVILKAVQCYMNASFLTRASALGSAGYSLTQCITSFRVHHLLRQKDIVAARGLNGVQYVLCSA